MAIPPEELLQEDFDFPLQGYNIEQIRQTIQNRLPARFQGGGYGGGYGGGNLGGGTGATYVGPDTTYSSGFDYARSIAGGIPASQMIQSGVSYSPDMPGGYTQADLNVVNLPRDVAPVFPQIPGTGNVSQPGEPMMPDAPTGTPMPIPLPNFFGGIPKFDFSKLQNLRDIKLFDFDPSQFSKSTPSVENNLDIPNFSIRTAAPGFSLPIPSDQPMMGEDGLIPLERPSLPQPNIVPPTMTPLAPTPVSTTVTPSINFQPPMMTPPSPKISDTSIIGGGLIPNIPPITPNINFEPPMVAKPPMPKQGGLFPTVGRGISAVRGAQEGFDEFKEGLKKQAIKGLFGIG